MAMITTHFEWSRSHEHIRKKYCNEIYIKLRGKFIDYKLLLE